MRRLFLFQDWPESLVQVLELMQQKRRVNSNEIKGKETITAQSMLQVVVLPTDRVQCQFRAETKYTALLCQVSLVLDPILLVSIDIAGL